MPALNWGLIQDGGVQESLMHAILYAEDPRTILFGRLGKDAGQDARTADGIIVYQSKYRDGLDMDGAVKLALAELKKITKYRAADHPNHEHWKNAKQWVLFANFSIGPNDDPKWKNKVVLEFKKNGLAADYWDKEIIEGKLAKNPEVRDVFFGHENRVLVGLKEAHDHLRQERIGGISLDVPMIGRDAELKLVSDFTNSPEKRILPVIGSGGIGKSRFLYQSLEELSKQGWRVLWGLPETMAKSSQWFRLLNGSQKTCVALDDPDDPGLFREVIEQLAASERRNWRVIISCRSDNSEILRKYKSNIIVENPIHLSNLDEPKSKLLINACLGYAADDAWLHKVYQFTRGNPGWLCLIADLVNQKKLNELPQKAGDIATMYVTSCLEKLDGATRSQAHTLLRWLSLWGTIVFEKGSEDREDIAFLENEGIPKNVLREILKQLVETGIVRNWGIGKRLFGVESLIIRQHILSRWLLDENKTGAYSVSSEGASLVKRLTSDGLPRVDATLLTISQLSLSRLDSDEAGTLLRPIFREMATAAKPANLIQQNYLIELVAKLGAADPESALDVLIAIRENMKENEEIKDSFWGKRAFTQDELLTSLSWTLFNIAENANDANVARRFLLEFREFFKLVKLGLKPDERGGKSPQKLLGRLLCESRRSNLFAKPAYDLAAENLLSDEWWPFVDVLASCVMQPIRELTEWVARSTLGFSTYAIPPESPEWGYLQGIRAKLFEIIKQENTSDTKVRVWTLLADSHKSIHRASARAKISPAWEEKYREVRANDLRQCVSILKTGASFAEATRARPMWEWYLKYGKEAELAELARECEQIYSGLSKWRIQDFFRFDYEGELKPETTRVVKLLLSDPNPMVFQDFFDEAQRYLNSVRDGRDMADDWRFGELAAALANDFSLSEGDSENALSAFVLSVLAKGDKAEQNASAFAVAVCRMRLGRLKADNGFVPGDWIALLLTKTQAKASLLYGIYASAHPTSLGLITKGEAECILSHSEEFGIWQRFWLLGMLVAAYDESFSTRAVAPLETLKGQYEASLCLNAFIRASYMTFLRYERKPSQELVKSIVEWIIQFDLDGVLLESHELETLVTNSGFTPTMRLFASLMKSRVELDSKPKQDERFQILPYHFNVKGWCRFDPTNADDIAAFHELCQLALGGNFTAIYWLPKYLPAIDSRGECVASFVKIYLEKNPNPGADGVYRLSCLASQYPVGSQAWADIASPICAKTRDMKREDREHVFFGLSRKESGALWSMPGEVASEYIDAVNEAKSLLKTEPANSPLRSYREWALRRAESDLRREEGFAEEIGDE